MRLLTIFLFITKIFILFNLLSISDAFNHYHYHRHHHHHNTNSSSISNNPRPNSRNATSDGYNNNNNNQAMPSLSSPTQTEQDNIASKLPQSFNGITHEVIGNGKLEELSSSSSTQGLYRTNYDDRNSDSNLNDNRERDSLRRHHSSKQPSSLLSSSLSIDNNFVESTPQPSKEASTLLYSRGLNTAGAASYADGNKNNPLIESAFEKQNNLNGDSSQYKVNQQYHNYDIANHNKRFRRDENRTSSLFSTDNPAHKDSRLRGHKQSDLCHKLCENNAHHNAHLICASNGRFYSSICDIKRYSCRHNIQLSKKPKSYCSKQRHEQQYQHQQQINLRTTITNDIDGDSILSTSDTNDTEQVRIIELKRRCNRHELEEMKMLLLHEFDGNLVSMFKYFDTNGDNYIEAHELWPRKDIESNKLMYAQVWDDHSTKCPSYKVGMPDRHHQHNHQYGYRLVEDQSKCWFFLDFAFQPKFLANPCSLSHLMLFDLTHPSSKFDWNSFQNAFKYHEEINGNSVEVSSQVVDQTTFRSNTQLDIVLGQSIDLFCFDNNSNNLIYKSFENTPIEDNDIDNFGQVKCLWTRYNLNLAALRDSHIYVSERIIEQNRIKNIRDLTLHLKDAQLYLSGQFKCTCNNFKNSAHIFEHIYDIRVVAPPRVDIRPQSQWSLPNSKVTFECRYDYIDTSNGEKYDKSPKSDTLRANFLTQNNTQDDLQQKEQFGLEIEWLKDNQELIVNHGRYHDIVARKIASSENISQLNHSNPDEIFYSSSDGDADDDDNDNNSKDNDDDDAYRTEDNGKNLSVSNDDQKLPKPKLSQISERASITMASSKLSLENLKPNDSGLYTCQAKAPINYTHFLNKKPSTISSSDINALDLLGDDHGTLLVQENPKADKSAEDEFSPGAYLWMFHDNGISIYRIQNDDGQEMELIREINGHSVVSGEVDGNWNQLTLCGGLNPEQVVICEWSDNALYIDVDDREKEEILNTKPKKKSSRKYIYIGQPNLNRIIVMDGLMFEIVAIINTEPQPRKLHLYKPNKIHLSKWVRRRLSPIANARWMSAIGEHAHSLKSTPESELYSNKPLSFISKRHTRSPKRTRQQERKEKISTSASASQTPTFASKHKHSALIQHDIWLLCYGQPMVVDPSGEEPSNIEDSSSFYPEIVDTSTSTNSTLGTTTTSSTMPSATATTNQSSHRATINGGSSGSGSGSGIGGIHPFTPRLTTGGSPFAWSSWPNKESKLRNRKSVHIIQSTFFPRFLAKTSPEALHNHNQDDYNEQEGGRGNNEEITKTVTRAGSNSIRRGRNETVVGMFKRSTVLTTHHVFSGLARAKAQRYLNSAQFDLIQDLYVPPKPYSLIENGNHKIHYAYVTHYDDQRLFRVSMDDYSYDREIDLQDCDPINLMTTAQGLLVIQCRAPITHNLIGQLVLDQLTSSRIEFNANIRAQEFYLSPDHRYLISVYTNSTYSMSSNEFIHHNQQQQQQQQQQKKRRSINMEQSNKLQYGQSIVYVQLVTVSGLKLQYEIKTFLDISQCSFAWKDGYYAAIFVSSNHRDQQSEILSLRLADSRLELMARVPGLISTTRHKDQLIISSELQLAALSTNQGTYVVDLEDNRVSQSLRHHQAPPTLLWV